MKSANPHPIHPIHPKHLRNANALRRPKPGAATTSPAPTPRTGPESSAARFRTTPRDFVHPVDDRHPCESMGRFAKARFLGSFNGSHTTCSGAVVLRLRPSSVPEGRRTVAGGSARAARALPPEPARHTEPAPEGAGETTLAPMPRPVLRGSPDHGSRIPRPYRGASAVGWANRRPRPRRVGLPPATFQGPSGTQSIQLPAPKPGCATTASVTRRPRRSGCVSSVTPAAPSNLAPRLPYSRRRRRSHSVRAVDVRCAWSNSSRPPGASAGRRRRVRRSLHILLCHERRPRKLSARASGASLVPTGS